MDDDLVLHVQPEMRAKIWRHDYINFAKLIKKYVGLRDEPCQLFNNENEMTESRNKLVRSNSNIRQCTDAFIIFMSIYLSKHSNCAVELIKFTHVIRDAESNSVGMGWKTYDKQFRLRQAHERRPWDKINVNLWLRFMSPGLNDQLFVSIISHYHIHHTYLTIVYLAYT